MKLNTLLLCICIFMCAGCDLQNIIDQVNALELNQIDDVEVIITPSEFTLMYGSELTMRIDVINNTSADIIVHATGSYTVDDGPVIQHYDSDIYIMETNTKYTQPIRHDYKPSTLTYTMTITYLDQTSTEIINVQLLPPLMANN